VGDGSASLPTMGGVQGCINEAADLVQQGGGSPIKNYTRQTTFIEIIHCCKLNKN